ncbi:hypothetical protein BHE74_00010559 [Ensete ventricosum]|nr:hypothetical protein GW17_00035929 [Ensete ventricosum]RWW81073.1 hypothetical protein BHE74_00010559 [Ensete ventricosum]RZS10717.1 hypothetical protein BHM03_00041974 [Ensete ventricosum]
MVDRLQHGDPIIFSFFPLRESYEIRLEEGSQSWLGPPATSPQVVGVHRGAACGHRQVPPTREAPAGTAPAGAIASGQRHSSAHLGQWCLSQGQPLMGRMAANDA